MMCYWYSNMVAPRRRLSSPSGLSRHTLPASLLRAGRVGAMSSASVDDAEATKVRAVDDAPRTHRAARLAAGTETRIIVFARG